MYIVATLQDPLGIKKLEKRKENKQRKELKEELNSKINIFFYFFLPQYKDAKF